MYLNGAFTGGGASIGIEHGARVPTMVINAEIDEIPKEFFSFGIFIYLPISRMQLSNKIFGTDRLIRYVSMKIKVFNEIKEKLINRAR